MAAWDLHKGKTAADIAAEKQLAETIPRTQLGGSASLASGIAWFSYFTPVNPLTVTKLSSATRNTAAAGVTTARMGLYDVAANGALALVARTASDVTLWGTTFTLYQRALDTAGGYPAAFDLVPGKRYAIGLFVTATTAPALLGTAVQTTAVMGLDPILATALTAQTDLPATATPAVTSSIFWALASA